jgi:hypothetical protein
MSVPGGLERWRREGKPPRCGKSDAIGRRLRFTPLG